MSRNFNHRARGDIIIGYRAIGQILDKRDASGTNSTNNNANCKNPYAKAGFNSYNNTGANAGTGASDTSDKRDANSIGSIDHNSDNKNAYLKTGFSTYNITNASEDADGSVSASDTGGTRDAGGTGGADNNVDNKNASTKADFSTYNIADANAGAGAGDTSVTGEKVGNNTNNTGVAQLGKVGRVDKSGWAGLTKASWAGPTKAGWVQHQSRG